MHDEKQADELQREYALRFSDMQAYREEVWKILTHDFFQGMLPSDAKVLDLGAGWGEFINHIQAAEKWAMDLNPDCGEKVAPGVRFLQQDCSQTWEVEDNTLDVVFTSNFFEHLPTKDSLAATLLEAKRCLKPGGKLICLGPNIKYLPGLYWDFWDHYTALTELSLKEVMTMQGFRVEQCVPRFLPYTMVNASKPPLFFVRLYLRMPWAWRFFGKQFLVVGVKP